MALQNIAFLACSDLLCRLGVAKPPAPSTPHSGPSALGKGASILEIIHCFDMVLVYVLQFLLSVYFPSPTAALKMNSTI